MFFHMQIGICWKSYSARPVLHDFVNDSVQNVHAGYNEINRESKAKSKHR